VDQLSKQFWDDVEVDTLGGDVNITDEDNESPLFTVESVAVARWLVDHGAHVDIKNSEGISVSDIPTERARLNLMGCDSANRPPVRRVSRRLAIPRIRSEC